MCSPAVYVECAHGIGQCLTVQTVLDKMQLCGCPRSCIRASSWSNDKCCSAASVGAGNTGGQSCCRDCTLWWLWWYSWAGMRGFCRAAWLGMIQRVPVTSGMWHWTVNGHTPWKCQSISSRKSHWKTKQFGMAPSRGYWTLSVKVSSHKVAQDAASCQALVWMTDSMWKFHLKSSRCSEGSPFYSTASFQCIEETLAKSWGFLLTLYRFISSMSGRKASSPHEHKHGRGISFESALWYLRDIS